MNTIPSCWKARICPESAIPLEEKQYRIGNAAATALETIGTEEALAELERWSRDCPEEYQRWQEAKDNEN